jgi:ABC-type iron transport system FetAB ATPase subunit
MPKPALPLFGRRTKLAPRMSHPTPPLLQVRGSRKDSGGRWVVDDVSFDVSAGEAIALVGPPFRSRCRESTSQCTDQLPKLETLSEGRRVRCFNRNTVHD